MHLQRVLNHHQNRGIVISGKGFKSVKSINEKDK